MEVEPPHAASPPVAEGRHSPLALGVGELLKLVSSPRRWNGRPQVEPASWLLGEAPAEYREVAEAKQNAEAGEEIVLRGRIGGRLDPISGESPAFIIMDASVPSCADKDHDSCPTPWDYCCETPDSKAANSATIVVLDANGNPTDEDITAAGLAPLDEIIVVGTVKARPNQSVFEIHATGIHKRAGG